MTDWALLRCRASRVSCTGTSSLPSTHSESLTSLALGSYYIYVSTASSSCLSPGLSSNMSNEAPPPYEQLFPEIYQAMGSLSRARRETRRTTITLQEILFPSGCPCHPGRPDQHRRATSPSPRTTWVPRGCPEVIERPTSERTSSSNSNSSSASQSSGETSRPRNRRPWDWLSQGRTSSLR